MNKRTHDLTLDIDAPTGLVWRALTEAEQIVRWFAPEVEVKPGEGGSVRLSWGPGMEGTAPITGWEPGKRLAWTEGEGPGSTKMVEFRLEGEGGKTKLRLVHSGFGEGASFDDEYDSTAGGWRTFLAMLKFGLERHPHQPAVNLTALRMLPSPGPNAWEPLTGASGLAIAPADLTEGGTYRATFAGTAISGQVLRTPRPGYACLSVREWGDALMSIFVEGREGRMVTITAVLFGEAAARAPQVRAEIDRLSASLA